MKISISRLILVSSASFAFASSTLATAQAQVPLHRNEVYLYFYDYSSTEQFYSNITATVSPAPISNANSSDASKVNIGASASIYTANGSGYRYVSCNLMPSSVLTFSKGNNTATLNIDPSDPSCESNGSIYNYMDGTWTDWKFIKTIITLKNPTSVESGTKNVTATYLGSNTSVRENCQTYDAYYFDWQWDSSDMHLAGSKANNTVKGSSQISNLACVDVYR